MKLSTKLLCVVMSLAMVFSVFAVSTVASAEETKYDDNIVVSYDQYIMDYSYGTGLSAAWPRQVTFNKDGWMRVQSRTPEEVAADEYGHCEQQWQYRGLVTPEYEAQFKNSLKSIQDSSFYIYAYIDRAELKNPNTGAFSATANVELELNCVFSVDSDFDGVLDKDITIRNIDKSKVSPNNFRFLSTSMVMTELEEYISIGCDYKFKEFNVNVQNYDFAKGSDTGLAKVDVFISPFYSKNIPGFESYNDLNAMAFNAATEIDKDSFTINQSGINVNEWKWDTDDESSATKYGLGDFLRDENNCPIRVNNTAYNPVPIPVTHEDPVINCSGLKATKVTTNSVILAWNSDGEAASYAVNCNQSAFNKNVTAKSATVTGLKAGTTYKFRVRALNKSNKYGRYTDYLTVTTASAPKISSATVTAAKTVKVTWGKVNGAASYKVERRIGSGKWTVLSSSVKTTSYTDKKATAGGTYQYRVTASGAVSAAKSVKVMAYTAKPTIKATGAKKALTVKVSKKVTNANGYQYQVALKSNMKGAKSYTSTKISKLKAKKTYYVRARAYQKVGSKKFYGAWSKAVKAKTK